MPASVSSGYSIVEPHPSAVPSKSLLRTGRGGAGNFTRAPASITEGASATGPAARASMASLSKPRHTYATGRGGFGNVHDASERAMFSFDEELERQMNREKNVAPVYVGRGGAGNIRSSGVKSVTIRRDSDSSASSTASSESGADIATRKIKESWKKMVRA